MSNLLTLSPTTRQGPPDWHVFLILTCEDIDVIISAYFMVVCANNQFVPRRHVIQRNLHGDLKQVNTFYIQKRNFFLATRGHIVSLFFIFFWSIFGGMKLAGSKILSIIGSSLNNYVPFVKFPELENYVYFSVSFSYMIRI